jgi:pyruvate dehydrogenase E2 component (dihydrolipoamide acetyltransferase)
MWAWPSRSGAAASLRRHFTAQQISISNSLMARMQDLISRVRAGRFRSSEIADSTITVSSLGDRGVETLYGVIYPPQVAIVGFGKVAERPWVSSGACSRAIR